MRALAMGPVAMLFDEPTSALDPEMVNEVRAPISTSITVIADWHNSLAGRSAAHASTALDCWSLPLRISDLQLQPGKIWPQYPTPSSPMMDCATSKKRPAPSSQRPAPSP